MDKKSIYIVQFGTGTSVNLLPLAAGQIYSRLKQDDKLCEEFNLAEIIFRRPDDPDSFATQLDDVFVIGFSCFLWSVNISLRSARAVKERFPGALIVVGGPSIPKDPEYTVSFLNKHPFIDVICIGEGEEVFVSLCHCQLEKKDFSDIPGIIYRDRDGQVRHTAPEDLCLEDLPSPYLDGTFDDLYKKYGNQFSGIIWETNRGCPYQCTFCTWGNLPSRKIREKPIDQVREEIEWIGKNNIKYIAMCDSNFGIRERDIEVAALLAACKKKYGVPDFISVSWVKNSSDKVLNIGEVLKKSGIGFRVTLSLESLNPAVLKAVKRPNIKKKTFQETKEKYRSQKLFSYTELMLGLPFETLESFLNGIEECLSDSVYDQLYVYPCFLFPNTELASTDSRKRYAIEGKIIPNRYTKSKELQANEEQVEIVIGTEAMPRERWLDAFVIGYYTLAIHDDRLAFFILHYLKRMYSIKIIDLIIYGRKMSYEENLPLMRKSFSRLEDTAREVQKLGNSHLIEPGSFGIPYDPPEGVFLELLMDKCQFYDEFLRVVEAYLKAKAVNFDQAVLKDLFIFQNAVMAHPNSPDDGLLQLNYNWVEFFVFAFGLKGEELRQMKRTYKVVDPKPSNGDPLQYLKNHWDIRGVPAFNEICDEDDKLVFPPLYLQAVSAQVSLSSKEVHMEAE